jgi:hypothetical protein
LVIQFSRMNAPRPQKGDACVLWRQWRLVGDQELYDVVGDPSQKEDVAARHLGVVAKMRTHYERWWAGVEPRLDEFGRIVLGSKAENPTLLSPCEWADLFLDQSAQVRRGERKNGVWRLEVERAGDYQFELRRWPQEADTAITAATPPYQAADGMFPAGVALPVAKARFRIQGYEDSMPVAPDDKSVVFTATLKPGPTELQTWFFDADGKELCGAYYVYVRLQKIQPR